MSPVGTGHWVPCPRGDVHPRGTAKVAGAGAVTVGALAVACQIVPWLMPTLIAGTGVVATTGGALLAWGARRAAIGRAERDEQWAQHRAGRVERVEPVRVTATVMTVPAGTLCVASGCHQLAAVLVSTPHAAAMLCDGHAEIAARRAQVAGYVLQGITGGAA